jgi:hypothetical protein
LVCTYPYHTVSAGGVEERVEIWQPVVRPPDEPHEAATGPRPSSSTRGLDRPSG